MAVTRGLEAEYVLPARGADVETAWGVEATDGAFDEVTFGGAEGPTVAADEVALGVDVLNSVGMAVDADGDATATVAVAAVPGFDVPVQPVIAPAPSTARMMVERIRFMITRFPC